MIKKWFNREIIIFFDIMLNKYFDETIEDYKTQDWLKLQKLNNKIKSLIEEWVKWKEAEHYKDIRDKCLDRMEELDNNKEENRNIFWWMRMQWWPLYNNKE